MEKRWSPYNRIARPMECHQVATLEAYAAAQLAVILDAKRKRPSMNWRDPFEADADGVQAFVSGGRWVVNCTACNNHPVFDPDWHVARCFECGAIYRLTAPNNWDTAELILMARAVVFTRNWVPATTRIVDLIDDNIKNGDQVGLDDAAVAEWRARDDANVIQATAQAVDAQVLPTRAIVFVDDNEVPHILHDNVVVTAAVDAQMFAGSSIDETQAQADATVAALTAVGAMLTAQKGGA